VEGLGIPDLHRGPYRGLAPGSKAGSLSAKV
jgi:hypothetical protein